MTRSRVLAAAAVLAASAGSALAVGPDITATHTGISPGFPMQWSVTGPGGFVNPGEAGCFNFTFVSGTYTGVSGNFSTFCLELTELVAVGTDYTYKVTPAPLAPEGGGGFTFPLGPAGADLMAELFGRFYSTLNFTSNVDCAAFQTAVWEIVYDPNLTINGLGDSYFIDFGANNAAVLPLAQSWLNALDGTGPRASLDAFVNPDFQDQIIPAPGTLALLGLGGLLAARRRR